MQVIRNSKTVIANLRKSKYLGLNLCYQEDEITIYQKVYIKNLERVNVERHLRHNLPEMLSNNIKDVLRQKVGQLLWVCNQWRLDISFDVSNTTSNAKNVTIKQLIDVNKTKTNQYDLKFQAVEKQSKLVIYVDAAFGNLLDGGSQSAYPIFFVNPNEKFNSISW